MSSQKKLNKMAKSEKQSGGAKGGMKSGTKSGTRGGKQAVPLTIAEEIAIFLKSGGKIQQIPSGVSGQVNLAGPKHIKLGNQSGKPSNASNK